MSIQGQINIDGYKIWTHQELSHLIWYTYEKPYKDIIWHVIYEKMKQAGAKWSIGDIQQKWMEMTGDIKRRLERNTPEQYLYIGDIAYCTKYITDTLTTSGQMTAYNYEVIAANLCKPLAEVLIRIYKIMGHKSFQMVEKRSMETYGHVTNVINNTLYRNETPAPHFEEKRFMDVFLDADYFT